MKAIFVIILLDEGIVDQIPSSNLMLDCHNCDDSAETKGYEFTITK